jgi:DNA ligase 1
LREALSSRPLPILVSPERTACALEEIDRLFAQARERGNEGLLLKRKGSVYEPGRRSGAWLKLKRPYGTLDVVVTAAEPGQGRRAIFLSDYTFAVRSARGFVNVGKAYSGLTDSEVKELTRVLRASSTEKFGRVFLVKPEVVLEVAFDGVQKAAATRADTHCAFPASCAGAVIRRPANPTICRVWNSCIRLRWRRENLPKRCRCARAASARLVHRHVCGVE